MKEILNLNGITKTGGIGGGRKKKGEIKQRGRKKKGEKGKLTEKARERDRKSVFSNNKKSLLKNFGLTNQEYKPEEREPNKNDHVIILYRTGVLHIDATFKLKEEVVKDMVRKTLEYGWEATSVKLYGAARKSIKKYILSEEEVEEIERNLSQTRKTDLIEDNNIHSELPHVAFASILEFNDQQQH
mmetsp:Transcript_10710/g.15665  ORF Transcript_10710/g.15665 Transcript_10710/m.15665 type:complete len:186 (+) Transcript_10710:16-573(+)